jgi:autotransporter-associated beta strand protein
MKSILHQLVSRLSSPFQKETIEGITENNLGRTSELFVSNKKRDLNVALFFALICTLLHVVQSSAQTAPVAQSLPFTQNFGTATFTSMPVGMAAWSGANKTTQALAETGTYTGNATLTTATGSTTTGGMFGFATSSNARVYIQQSSNATNGTSAVVAAINTGSATGVVVSYQLELINGGATTQDFGLELMYRAGTTGAWTAVPSSVITFGPVTTYTTQTLTYTVSGLTASTDYQFRWANWRPAGSGNSKGIGIDNISITGSSSPSISTSGSLVAVNTTYGSPSATPASFFVSGSNITGGILVTPPNGYEVCLSVGGTYTDTVTVGTSGTIAPTQVFVRLKATATFAGSPYSGNIVCSSLNAGNANVATVSSTVSKKTITVTDVSVQNKIYNRTTAATITATPVGEVNSDGLSFSGGGTFNNFNAGAAKPVTAALVLNGANTSSYTFTQPTGLTAEIFVKDVTISGAAANNKPYDGTSSATLSGTLTGVISPDDVSVSLVGSFDAPFVDNNIVVTSFASLFGDGSIDNYNLVQPTGLTANITKKGLTVSGATAQNKVFDGNTDAVITGTLVGVVFPDFVDFIGTGTFQTAGPGQNIAVTSTSTIEGDIDNYDLIQPTGLTANISEEELIAQTITFDPLADAVYGDANIPLTATSDSGLAVTYTSSDTNVATIVPGVAPGTYEVHIVSVGAGFTTITASQSGDLTYDSATPVQQTLNVLQKELTANETAADKVYDRTNTAVVSGTLIGVVGSDDVTLAGSGVFASVNVGTAINVFPSSTLEGAAAANYTLTESTLTANITPKALTVSGAAASNKVYDGNTTAAISGATLVGVIAPDAVSVSGGGTFASKDVANAIAVTSALTLNGAQAGNYAITQPATLSANITPLALTITGLSGVDKVYDRTTPATLSGTASLVGVIAPDDVSLTGTVTSFFNNKTVANAKPISVFGYTLAGAQLANYTVAQPTGITANVTPFSLTIFGAAATSKLFDGTDAAVITGTLVGTLGADVVTLIGTGTFATSAVGNGISVTSTSTIGGTDGPNYVINPQPTGLTANITAAPNYLGTQDFEAVPATPTLTFTTSDGGAGTIGVSSGFSTGQSASSGDAPLSSNLYSGGVRGYKVFPSSGLASRTLTFSAVDASAYTNLQASFRIAAMSIGSTGNGIDNGTVASTILGANTPADFALIEVSPDGGTTWYKQAVVTTSGSNARWAFTGTGTGTRSYAANDTYSNFVVAGSNTVTGTNAITTAIVTSLPSSANLRIRITLESNATSEYWIVDDVNISGIVGTVCTTPDPVTSLAATNGSSSSAVSWNYGSCYDEAIVVASTAAFTSAVPTGDGTAYTVTSQSFIDAGNSPFDGGKIVYKGSSNAVTITSLTNGTTYNFKVFVRKGTNWTTGDVTSATPVEAQYFWDADGATTAATGGTGTWDNAATSNWRTPNATGTLAAWVTNSTPLNATIAGTAGTITLPASITIPTAPNLYINTSGYTLASTITSAVVIPATNMVLANNVLLALSPNINIATPVNGSFSTGSITGGSNSGITLNSAQGTSPLITQRINLAINNSVISAPITIASLGGTGTGTVAALVGIATGTSLSSVATITNNTAIKTALGATSGNDITANGVISGSADLMFAAGANGGAGTINLKAANNYTGATLFNLSAGGIVKLGIANALPASTSLTMGYSSGNGGILDLNGFNQTLGSLSSGAGSGTIRNNGVATDATLTLNGAASTTFGFAITDGTSKIAFVKLGAGVLTLSSTSNTYSGGTTISGGAIQLGAAGVLANAGGLTLNGGSLNTAGFAETVGTLNLNSTGTLALGAGNHTLTFANSSAVNWAGSALIVTGWTGVAGQSNASGAKIQVGAGGLTLTQLAKISFQGYTGAAILLPSGEVVPPGPTLSVTVGNLDHGTACLNTAATFIDYTISNIGAAAAGVTVISNNPEFAVTNAPTSVAAGGTATYRVTFTPTATGLRNAQITITTSTANSNSPVHSNVFGNGNANVTYYADLDEDTYGNSASSVVSCTGAPIYLGHLATLNNTDCNDNDATKYQSVNLYTDVDGDGYDAGTGQVPVCYGATVPAGYSATTLGTDCNDNDNTLTTDCSAAGAVVNLTMFVQGYYTFDHAMNSVRVNQEIEGAEISEVEMLTVELHDAEHYGLVVATTAMLHTDGSLSANFGTVAAGSYYIAVKGRNMIQTWSAVAQAVGTTPLDYDFSTSASQAYGDNMIDMGDGVFAFYSGDIVQDELIEFSDYSAWETDAFNFAFGDFATDLTGDGLVEFSDYSIWEANAFNFIFAEYPFE